MDISIIPKTTMNLICQEVEAHNSSCPLTNNFISQKMEDRTRGSAYPGSDSHQGEVIGGRND